MFENVVFVGDGSEPKMVLSSVTVGDAGIRLAGSRSWIFGSGGRRIPIELVNRNQKIRSGVGRTAVTYDHHVRVLESSILRTMVQYAQHRSSLTTQ